MSRGNITLAGADQSYVFNFGANAFCRLEEATGRKYTDLLAELVSGTPSMRLVRQLCRCALVSEREVSLEQAGLIYDDVGGARFLQEIGEALMPSAGAEVQAQLIAEADAAIARAMAERSAAGGERPIA